jgi:hypothetical protein
MLDGAPFSTKVAYRILHQDEPEDSTRPIWGLRAPGKGKIFGWLALKYRLWTSDRRQRHGLQEDTAACYNCLQ